MSFSTIFLEDYLSANHQIYETLDDVREKLIRDREEYLTKLRPIKDQEKNISDEIMTKTNCYESKYGRNTEILIHSDGTKYSDYIWKSKITKKQLSEYEDIKQKLKDVRLSISNLENPLPYKIKNEYEYTKFIEDQQKLKQKYEYITKKLSNIKNKIFFPSFFTENGITEHQKFISSKRGQLFSKLGEILSDGSSNKSIHRFHTNDPAIAKFIKYFISDNENTLILPNSTYEGVISNVFSYFRIPEKEPKDGFSTWHLKILNLDYVFIILKEGQKENSNLISALISIKDGLITRKSSFIPTLEFKSPKVLVFSNESLKLRSKIDDDTFEVLHYKYFITPSDVKDSESL